MKKFCLTYLILAIFSAGNLFAQVQSRMELTGKSAFIQGTEAFANEEYDRALNLYHEAYKNLGSRAGVSFALAETYLEIDDLANAALYGKEAVSIQPQNKWYRLRLAEIYRSAGRNQATLSELNTLLEYHPKDFDALYMLAETYRDYGEFVQSNQTLDKILKLTGPVIQIYFRKFRNYEALGVQDSAIAQLEKIRGIDPDNLEMLNTLGKYYVQTGLKDRAKSVLLDALRRNPRDPESLINLAGIYIDDMKWDSAGTLIGNFVSDPLIEAEKKMRIARFMYGRHQEVPSNTQLRIETGRIMDLFTEHEADYGPAFTISGQFYAQNGQNELALDKLKRANKLLPEDDIAWRQRLQLLLTQNKYDKAIEVGKKADEQIPDDAFIQFFTGSAYMMNGNNEEAEKWLERASYAPARRPFKSVVYSALGDVRANLGDHEASDKAYETALRYDPDNDNAMNNYAYNLALRGEELEKAKELSLKAIEVAPENAAYLDTVGWVYYKLEDYDRARRFIRASINTGEASAEVLEHLGDVYQKLENMNEARKYWKQALDKDSTRTHLKEKIN